MSSNARRGVLTLAALIVPSLAAAQVIDAGSFAIARDGRTVGRETFEIRRMPGVTSAPYESRAVVTLDGRQLNPSLRADAQGGAVEYRLVVTGGPEGRETTTGKVMPGRFSATAESGQGSSARREYVVADGAVIIDDDIFHQYYFLLHPQRAGDVPVVIPRRHEQVMVRVAQAGNENITIAGTNVSARTYTLTEPDGATRRLWVDGDGRVLKVEVGNVTAVREAIPR